MESYRHTINKARETGTGVGGIESGVFGLGIRSVVPVFYQGAQIEIVEIGLSLEKPLLEEFKRNYGAELLLYVEKEPGKKSPKVFASTLDGDFLSPDLFRRCFVSGEMIFLADKLDSRNIAVIVGPVRDFSSQIIGVIEIGIDREPTLALLKQYGSIAAIIGFIGLALSVSFVLFISMLFTRRIR